MGGVVERRRRPIRVRIGLLLFPLFLIAGCTLSPGSGRGGPSTWIDAPLDGSQLSMAPVTVVLHAASQSGIQTIELTLNGQALASLTPQDPKAHLVNEQTNWAPDAPGTYILEARAIDGKGLAGSYAQAKVVIGAPTSTPSASPTVVPTTVTVSPTATATSTPTPTASPTVAGPSLASVSLSDHQVYWGGGCQPDSFTITATVNHPAQVKAVIFFYRLEDAQTHKLGGWSQGDAMNPQGGGAYQLSRRGSDLEQSTRFAQAYVHYQLALQTSSGAIVRSQVFSDLSLSLCSSGPAPTATGIIIAPPGPITILTPTVPVIQ